MAARRGRAKLTNREFIYRSAFELGRHIIGYEVQKVLALVDQQRRAQPPIGEHGLAYLAMGKGGRSALYASAPSIGGSMRFALAVISTIGTIFGGSRSTAIYLACSSSSAMPRSLR